MHVRYATTKSKGKTYRYPQLVESYRRPKDGMPATRVIATLKGFTEQDVENLRVALAASREGKRVSVVATPLPRTPDANLEYLGAAVLLELWRRYGFDDVLHEALPAGAAKIRPADVVFSLIVHRLLAPGSKLAATSWYPRTALPELLQVDPESFGNSRLHRVLEVLGRQTSAIMSRLPDLYARGQGAFTCLFVDMTDATFEGEGPEMARKGWCKDDVIRQRVGVALLCNERGYPLRWEVVEGNAAEAPIMMEHMRVAARTTWGAGLPIVADRAVGRSAYLAQLLSAGVPFVTALVRNEFGAYAPHIDLSGLVNLDPSKETERVKMEKLLGEAGFTRVDDTLYVQDLGVVSRAEKTVAPKLSAASPLDEGGLDNRLQSALQFAHKMIELRKEGAAATFKDAAALLELTQDQAKEYRRLLKLNDDIQDEILSGVARGISLMKGRKLAELAPERQRAAFDELLRARDQGELATLLPTTPKASTSLHAGEPVELRAIAYFNPQMQQNRRKHAQEKVDKAREHVRQLNAAVAAGTSHRTPRELYAAVERQLRELGLLTLFTIELTKEQTNCPQVEIQLNTAEWTKRRARDGLCIIVSNPSVELQPEEACRLYRSKDAVEKDFQTIKTVIRMLPIRHWTDPKVTAHITICILALALERLLRDAISPEMSAERALELLSSCHLNSYGGTSSEERVYLITKPDNEQRKLLKTLDMEYLVNDDRMAEMLHPR